jgi:four helix bundle protein
LKEFVKSLAFNSIIREQTFTITYTRLQMLNTRLGSVVQHTFAENSKIMAKDKGYRSLIAYQKAFAMGTSIFQLSKKFPKEEQFGLTSQIRRSSRSVGANLVEGYRKRRYPKMFLHKLNTSDGECSETIYWLEVALACEYITRVEFEKHESILDEVGALLGSMIKAPEKFAPRS